MNEGKKIKIIAEEAIIASIYVVLTLILYPLSYGSPQFRISECLVLLVFFNKRHAIGVCLGVFIANFFNPTFGLVDLFVGTLSTVIASLLIMKTKKLFIASFFPTITSLFVVVEVWYFAEIPFYLVLIEIVTSMFIIESIIGFVLFKLLSRNKTFLKAVKNEREELENEI